MKRHGTHAWLGLLLAAFALSAEAGAVRTWRAATTGDWFDAANWVEGASPVAGDDVFVTNAGGAVLLTNATDSLNSLWLSQRLTFSNWVTQLTAIDMRVASGGLVSCAGPFAGTAMPSRVWIACSNLTVDFGGRIDVSGLGYQAGSNNVAEGVGSGPGGGKADIGASFIRGGGGGHGGRGGQGMYQSSLFSFGGIPNGAAEYPTNAGSGGASASVAGEAGGPGGGAVLIDATGAVVVDGAIRANGQSYRSGTRSGGGAGGSILVRCATVAGSGVLQASGGVAPGTGDGGGGGGGGRIALLYDPAAQSLQPSPGTRVQALGGSGSSTGEIGTVYFPDGRLLQDVEVFSTNSIAGQIVWPLSTWGRERMVVSNVGVRFPGDGFALTVTNDLVIVGGAGVLDLGSTSMLSNDLRMTFYNAQGGAPSLVVGGNLRLTNAATLVIYAAATGAVAGAWGGTVTVAGDLVLGPGCWIRPQSNPTNGGSAVLRAANVQIAATGGINADGAGYLYASGPGRAASNIRPGGGGYGGVGGGGEYVDSFGGGTYGMASDPTEPGSGGGSYGVADQGGRGGGLIRLIVSNRVYLAGTLTAGGAIPMASAGAGAGGGVAVLCRVLAGTGGVIRANGGSRSVSGAGGGGGGRIALVYDAAAQAAEPKPQIAISALGGVGLDRGDLGSVYLTDAQVVPSPVIADLNGRLAGVGGLTFDSLRISNCWVRLAGPEARLTVSNACVVEGASGRLDLGGDSTLPMWTASNHYAVCTLSTGVPSAAIGGSLSLLRGGRVVIYSGATNSESPEAGGLVDVRGTISVGSNTALIVAAQPTNGGVALVQAGDFLVLPAGIVSADSAGFLPQTGYGRGTFGGSRCGGGGYGGRGGNGAAGAALGGSPYGSSNAPVLPGSGGATYSATDRGGFGGGAVRVVARESVVVDGTISANGMSVSGTAAAGSGGAIYITCERFGGSGVLRASGGAAGALAGGGGGGRIAVSRVHARDSFAGTFTVQGGAGSSTGGVGTIVRVSLPSRAATILIR